MDRDRPVVARDVRMHAKSSSGGGDARRPSHAEIRRARRCQTEEDPLEASKAAPEPLKLQLAALDSEARALVDFVVWNLCAVEKISKKRDKLFPVPPRRRH